MMMVMVMVMVLETVAGSGYPILYSFLYPCSSWTGALFPDRNQTRSLLIVSHIDYLQGPLSKVAVSQCAVMYHTV